MPKFITNQNIEIELECASVGDRILAFLLDSLIMAAYAIAMAILVFSTDSGTTTFSILLFPLMFYSLLFEIFGGGQSPGKKAREIKVVKLDGSSPHLGNYLLRWMFRIIDIYLFYGCIGVVSMVASKNGQRLGDRVAGTTVIKARDSGSVRVFNIHQVSDYKVSFPVVKTLSDEQIDLLKKALAMNKNYQNHEVVAQLAQKLKEKLNIQSSQSDLELLEIIIKDYEHIANEG